MFIEHAGSLQVLKILKIRACIRGDTEINNYIVLDLLILSFQKLVETSLF